MTPYLHTNCGAACKCDGFLTLEKLNASNVRYNSARAFQNAACTQLSLLLTGIPISATVLNVQT
jgi:hypothetical protein